MGATFALFRALHGRAAGLAASLLLALSFHHIVFSQEARNYALFGFLAVASAHALWRALAEGGRRRWAIYIACAVGHDARGPRRRALRAAPRLRVREEAALTDRSGTPQSCHAAQ